MSPSLPSDNLAPVEPAPVASNARPSVWAMLGLAALAVELPFFAGFVLAQFLVACAHCRGIWKLWPVLPGMLPSFLLGRRWFHQLPERWFWLGAAVFTIAFVLGLLAMARRTSRWRWVLGAGLALSCLLAVLGHALIAA